MYKMLLQYHYHLSVTTSLTLLIERSHSSRIASTNLWHGQLCVEKAFDIQQVSSVILSQKRSGMWLLDKLGLFQPYVTHMDSLLSSCMYELALALSSTITCSKYFFNAALPGTWYRWSRQGSKSSKSRLSTIRFAMFELPIKTASFLVRSFCCSLSCT